MDGRAIAFVVVGGIAVALAIYNFLTEKKRPMKQQRNHTYQSPPRTSRSSSPKKTRRRSRSSSREKSSSNGCTTLASSDSSSQDAQLSSNCGKCGEKKSLVEVYPCHHSSTCKDCFDHHLKSSDKCPVCDELIVSCHPQKNIWGKCKNCKKFSKLILIKPCNHSVICTDCLNQHLKSGGNCPDCKKPNEKCDPKSDTLGICKICDKLRLLLKFKPCGHANYCEPHIKMFFDMKGERCIDCGKKVFL